MPTPDFANDVPSIRFYVVGPVNDGVDENAEMSNYWFASDTFPIVEIFIGKIGFFIRMGHWIFRLQFLMRVLLPMFTTQMTLLGH